MSEHHHFIAPDIGVIASDLFIYNPEHPGTGGLASRVVPSAFPGRDTVLVRTHELLVTLYLNRLDNTAQITLTHRIEPPSDDRRTFALADGFIDKSQVTLSIMFDQWKLVAVIDGKPLLIRHTGWVAAHVDEAAALPAAYDPLLNELASSPVEVQRMWRYAMVLQMIHDEEARIINSHLEGDTLHLRVENLAGDKFSIIRPPMSEEAEQFLLEQVRAVMGRTP